MKVHRIKLQTRPIAQKVYIFKDYYSQKVDIWRKTDDLKTNFFNKKFLPPLLSGLLELIIRYFEI